MSPSNKTALDLLCLADSARGVAIRSIAHAISSYAVDTLLTLIFCRKLHHDQAALSKNG